MFTSALKLLSRWIELKRGACGMGKTSPLPVRRVSVTGKYASGINECESVNGNVAQKGILTLFLASKLQSIDGYDARPAHS